jgi:Na+/H+ antiporter NhaD/arsenite permease-like protein
MKLPQIRIPIIPHDKALHFLYGVIVALVVLYVCLWFGVQHGPAKFFAFVAAVTVGVVKEFGLDQSSNKVSEVLNAPPAHTVSLGDAIATSLGGLVIWVS